MIQNNLKLIIDFSNIIYSVFFIDMREDGVVGNEDFVRHLCLNKILSIKKRLDVYHKNVFLCFDHKINWRKKIFEYYKANRAKARKESDIDWSLLYSLIDSFYTELRTYVPFYVLRNQYIEADDWVAVLAKHFSELGDPVVIVSTDKDFYQLQKYSNVLYQYNHLDFSKIKVPEPIKQLQVKVLCGDAGDGIPNVRSDDDTFVTEGKRQKPLGEKKAWELISNNAVEQYLKENQLEHNFKRNDRLINFDKIPLQISEAIITRYVSYKMPEDGMILQGYLDSKKMKIIEARMKEFFE